MTQVTTEEMTPEQKLITHAAAARRTGVVILSELVKLMAHENDVTAALDRIEAYCETYGDLARAAAGTETIVEHRSPHHVRRD